MDEGRYKDIVERAGGIFVGLNDGNVLFRADAQGRVLSLYAFACSTADDVAFALKAEREQVAEINVWEKAG